MSLLKLSSCEGNSFISSRQQPVLIKILLFGHFRDMYSFHVPYLRARYVQHIKIVQVNCVCETLVKLQSVLNKSLKWSNHFMKRYSHVTPVRFQRFFFYNLNNRVFFSFVQRTVLAISNQLKLLTKMNLSFQHYAISMTSYYQVQCFCIFPKFRQGAPKNLSKSNKYKQIWYQT